MNKKWLVTTILMLCIGSVAALYMGGMSLTGSISATAGTQPSDVTCNYDFVNISSETTYDCVYDNTDGTITMQFICDTSGLSSTDGKCNYENGKDIKFWVGIDNADYSPCESTPTKTITNGVHDISIKLEPHPNRCPVTGNYSVTGVIA
jgi:hypothetical protein